MKTYRMIGLGLVAGLAFAAASANAQIKNAPAGTMAKADQNFMNEAIEGDLSEINMGKLAQQKGQSQGIKQFGQMLEQDHSQNLQEKESLPILRSKQFRHCRSTCGPLSPWPLPSSE